MTQSRSPSGESHAHSAADGGEQSANVLAGVVGEEKRAPVRTEVLPFPLLTTPPHDASLHEVERQPNVSTRALWWTRLHAAIVWYLRRLWGFDQEKVAMGFFPSLDLILTVLGVSLTLTTMGLIEYYGFHPLGKGLHLFIPAFGASATVLFSSPKSPAAQPRSLFVGHGSAAIIGIALANAFELVGRQPLGVYIGGSISVALHVVFSLLTNCSHPPAYATAVTAAITPVDAMYGDRGFLFVITPVLLGCFFLFLMAFLLNNLFSHRSPYPKYWW